MAQVDDQPELKRKAEDVEMSKETDQEQKPSKQQKTCVGKIVTPDCLKTEDSELSHIIHDTVMIVQHFKHGNTVYKLRFAEKKDVASFLDKQADLDWKKFLDVCTALSEGDLDEDKSVFQELHMQCPSEVAMYSSLEDPKTNEVLNLPVQAVFFHNTGM